jgi:Reverse transcriptase (RNA-dependent DNA polymerase)
LDGYKIANFFSRSKSSRGGVLLLVKNTYCHSWKKLKLKSIESEFEVCGIETTIDSKAIKIVLVYRPSNPSNNGKLDVFLERLGDLAEMNCNVDSEMILMGDLNINMLEKTCYSDSLSELMDTFNLKLLNHIVPTRVANTSSTLLDHIYSNVDCSFKINVEQVSFSDHDCVECEFEIYVKPPKDSFKLIRDYSDENWQKFYALLSNEHWNDIFTAPNVDVMSNNFVSKLVEYFELCFPEKKIIIRANQRNKIRLSVATEALKNNVRELSERINHVERDNNTKIELRKELKSLKSYLGFCINNETRQMNDNKIKNSSNKSKAAWQLINKCTGKHKSSTTIESLKVGGNIITDQKLIANCLNKQFVEPQPDINDIDLNSVVDHIPLCEDKLKLEPVTETQVVQIIKDLKSKNSVSWDGISTKVLKQISPYIVKPFACLINQSFVEGKFPNNVKLSLLIASFKKDERENPANYRPIAMTSPISKVLEKAFLAQLETHLEKNKILSERQHGFKKGKSTVTALFDLVSEVYGCLENREKINLILYDFSNAFGCLQPQLLTKKLEKYGLEGEALAWINSFLTDRTQFVQLKSLDEANNEIVTRSDVSSCSMGVPQGTILGPVGFSVYDNDFPLRIILACLFLFADDSSIVVSAKNYPELVAKTEETNQNVINFSKDNFLRLNAKKTNLLHIHTAQTKNIEKPSIKINDDFVAVTEVSKLLGVKITETFNWKAHCDEVVSKLRSNAYRFSLLRANVSLKSIRNVYFADVQSHILYTIVIWGGSPHLEQVFVAQKRCIRAMAGKKYWRGPAALDSCKPLFQEHKILTVYSLYILEAAKFVKKYPEKFSKNSDHPDANIRVTRNLTYNENDLYVKPCRNLNFVQNPLIMLARIWNHLPETIKSVEDMKMFVKKVKILLFKHMFYDMHEFFSCKFD